MYHTYYCWFRYMQLIGNSSLIDFPGFSSMVPETCWMNSTFLKMFNHLECFNFGHWRCIFDKGLELFYYFKHKIFDSIFKKAALSKSVWLAGKANWMAYVFVSCIWVKASMAVLTKKRNKIFKLKLVTYCFLKYLIHLLCICNTDLLHDQKAFYEIICNGVKR